MDSGDDINSRREGTYFIHGSTIHPLMLFEQRTDDFLLEKIYRFACVSRPLRILFTKHGAYLVSECRNILITGGFIGLKDSLPHLIIGKVFHCRENFFRESEGCIAKLGFANFGYHFFDEAAEFLNFFMAGDDRFEHLLVRDLIGTGFYHADFLFTAGNRKLQIALLRLFQIGADNNFTVYNAHLNSGHRAIPGNIRNGDSYGGANHGRNLRRIILVHSHNEVVDVHVITHVFREKRTQRAINGTGNQNGLF